MKIDAINRRIYVRQSWLNDVLNCPERARLAMNNPHMRMPSDATIIGTAMHRAIETFIVTTDEAQQNTVRAEYLAQRTGTKELEEMVKVAVAEYQRLASEPHKTTGIDETVILAYLESMCTSWHTTIMPLVELGGSTELRFVLPLKVNINGFDIYIEGTIDYVSPSGVIWDWKTSGRSYSGAEKQKNAVQASMYAAAATIMNLVPDPNHIEFKYGVMLRQEKPKAQLVSLHRNQEHVQWIRNQIISACHMGMSLGTETGWLLNDQSNLCSAKWCDFWSVCKGATVSEQSLLLCD